MLKFIIRPVLIRPLLWSVFAVTAGPCFAQWWGNNAPVYNCGPCVPCRKSWGYHQTQWTRWPGAIYPDMVKADAGAPGEEIPPPNLITPPSNKEAEIRAPSPTRPPVNAPGTTAPSTGGQGGGAGGAAPYSPGDTVQPGAVPGQSFRSPGAMPGPVPGGGSPGPGTSPSPFGRPTTPEPGNYPPPGIMNEPSSGAAPQLRAPNSDAVVSQPARLSLDTVSRPLPPTARIRGASGMAHPSTVQTQPELLMPQLSQRPMNAATQKPRALRPPANNPFRNGTVRPAAHEEPGEAQSDDPPSAAHEDSADAGHTNRLRRG